MFPGDVQNPFFSCIWKKGEQARKLEIFIPNYLSNTQKHWAGREWLRMKKKLAITIWKAVQASVCLSCLYICQNNAVETACSTETEQSLFLLCWSSSNQPPIDVFCIKNSRVRLSPQPMKPTLPVHNLTATHLCLENRIRLLVNVADSLESDITLYQAPTYD